MHGYDFDADMKSVHKRLAKRHGVIAQLGERVVRNDEAEGSIPSGSTKVYVPHIFDVSKEVFEEYCGPVA
jgi:hypothetical protein